MIYQSDINLFRVRKAWKEIASQKGAFFLLENAIEVAKRFKLNVYNNKKECVWNYNDHKNTEQKC